jgi:hypothetical protein
MKNVNCWSDLRPYGIDLLTGEACGLSYRLLCDVTDKGRGLLQKAMGLPGLVLAEPWNVGNAQEPNVGSIMLPHCMLVPLGIFALLENDCREIWLCKNEFLIGVEFSDSPATVRAMEDFAERDIVRRLAYRGTAGDRNVHQMSGRIA